MINRLKDFDLILILSRYKQDVYRLRWVVIFLLGANLLAFGYAMTNFSLAGDDWDGLLAKPELIFEVFPLAHGRWLMYLFYKYILPNPFVSFFTIALCMGLNIFTALLITRLWGIRSLLSTGVSAALITLVPFWAEPFSFDIVNVAISLAFLLAVSSFAFMVRGHETKSTRFYALGALSIFFALAIYQISIISFVLVYGGFLIYRLLVQADWNPSQAVLFSTKSLITGILAVVGYFFSVKAQRGLSGVGEVENLNYSLSGGYVTTFSGFIESLWYLKQTLIAFLFQETHLFPLVFKWLFIFVLAFFVIYAAHKLVRLSDRRVGRIFIVILMLGVMLVMPFFTVLVRENHFIRYNILFSVGIFYALFFSVLMEDARSKLVRSATFILAIIAIVIFIHQNNVAFVGLKILNERDKVIASQILERVQTHPDYSSLKEVKPLVIVGKMPYKKDWPFGAPQVEAATLNSSIVRCSVFGCQFSRVEALLQLVSKGERFRRDLTKPEAAAVRRYVNTARNWPDPSSVAIVNGVIVIILDKSIMATNG